MTKLNDVVRLFVIGASMILGVGLLVVFGQSALELIALR